MKLVIPVADLSSYCIFFQIHSHINFLIAALFFSFYSFSLNAVYLPISAFLRNTLKLLYVSILYIGSSGGIFSFILSPSFASLLMINFYTTPSILWWQVQVLSLNSASLLELRSALKLGWKWTFKLNLQLFA